MTFEQDWGIGLVQATENLDEMLRVVENGRVTCCIGFEATFFSQGPTEDARNRVVDAYELYVQAIGPDKLRWGEDPKAGSLRSVDTGIGDVREWSERVALRSPYSFLFQGGAEKTDASPYMTSALLKELETPGRLFNFSFSVPLAWVAAHKPGAIVDLVVGVCSKLQPEHGYAGLAIIPWVREQYHAPSMGTVAGFVRRFRGLELDFPYLNARPLSQKPAIRGINWLTVLADPWVEKLGGRAALEAKLGPDIPIHRFPTGIVIQAGPRPQFGDVNRAERMPYYQRVSLALKPIRTTDIGSLLPHYGFGKPETEAYLARFDEDPA